MQGCPEPYIPLFFTNNGALKKSQNMTYLIHINVIITEHAGLQLILTYDKK